MSDPKLVQLARQIGTNVERHRAKRGLSRDALAARSKLGEKLLLSIEQGKRLPGLVTLLCLSEALRVPIDYFFA